MTSYRRRVQRLIRALRSGYYPQAIGRLMTKNGFCISGVMCDQFMQMTDEGTWLHGTTYYPDACFLFKDREYYLTSPQEVCDFFGIDGQDLFVLQFQNDYGIGFDVLADYLELLLLADLVGETA